MKFDFPIKDIRFEFECRGSAKVNLFCNGKKYPEHFITDLKDTNKFTIEFTKDDPADENSFARLMSVLINGYCFKDDFKNLTLSIENKFSISKLKLINLGKSVISPDSLVSLTQTKINNLSKNLNLNIANNYKDNLEKYKANIRLLNSVTR